MVERYGMIDEAGGHEPLYFGRTTDVAPYGISGPEYVRHSDYATLEAENTRLLARNAVLEKALQPFAAYLDTAAWDLNNNGGVSFDDHGMRWVYLTIGNFREARAALTPTKENDNAE